MQIKLYPTIEGIKLSDKDLVDKLNEESIELAIAIEENTNIKEEVFDVMQMCVNIIEKYNIDVQSGLLNHYTKLLKRGHEFLCK